MKTGQRIFQKKIIGLTAALFVGILTLSALPATAEEAVKQQVLVDKSRVTFQDFMLDKNLSWLHENLHRAKGLIIIPSLLKAGFVLGGSGGSGILILRDEKTGQWSQPAFYNIGSVTFGLQIGGEVAGAIMFVRTQKALEKLYTSSVKLGGDISAALGPVGAGVKSDIVADILSFTRTKGAYAGVSLEGAVIATRDEWNRAYYGREVRPVDIFVKRSVSNPGSIELRRVLAGAEQKKDGMSKDKAHYHIVERGDTLSAISRSYGVSVDELRRLNNIVKGKYIYPRQKILLGPAQ